MANTSNNKKKINIDDIELLMVDDSKSKKKESKKEEVSKKSAPIKESNTTKKTVNKQAPKKTEAVIARTKINEKNLNNIKKANINKNTPKKENKLSDNKIDDEKKKLAEKRIKMHEELAKEKNNKKEDTNHASKKNKKKKKLKPKARLILTNIYSVILIIVSIIFLVKLKKLDILPNKYFNIVMLAEIILMLVGILLNNLKKKVLKIIGIVLMSIMLVVNLFGIHYVSSTQKFIKKSFANVVKTSKEYYVITSKNNEAKKLPENSSVTYYKYSENIDKALKKLGKYNLTETVDLYKTMNDIVTSNGYLFVDKSSFDSAFEIVDTLKKDNYKIIKRVKLVTEEKKKKDVSDSYNIYIGGRDFTGALMDFNMLVTVNNNTHKILVTSIPRDYYMTVNGYGIKDSLEFMGLLGNGVNERSLEDLLGIKVNYSVHIYTQNLVDVVDKIGGVTFCSDKAFTTTHSLVLNTYNDTSKKFYVKKGCQTLNGIQALTVARERKNVGSDRQRQANCRQLALNIMKKVLSASTLANYSEVLNSFSGLYTTDMNEETITKLFKNMLENGNYTVEEQSLDGTDGNGRIRLNTVNSYVMVPSSSSVLEVSNKINSVIKEK